MFAVIKTGGKQYIVEPGSKIKVEKLDASQDNEVVFDNVLLVGDNEESTLVGSPYIDGYSLKGKVLRQGKGDKIIVFKYKSKKRYQKKQGHRQLFTEVEILDFPNSKTKTQKGSDVSATAKAVDNAKGESKSSKRVASKQASIKGPASKAKTHTPRANRPSGQTSK
jgi:large subunit ribosomal protein L21